MLKTQPPKVPGDRSERHGDHSTYVQIRELVKHLQKQLQRLHDGLDAQANRQEGSTDSGDRRAVLIYNYASGRMGELKSFLGDHCGEYEDEVLERWLQYADTSEYDALVDETLESPPTSSQDIQTRIMELDRLLTETFRTLGEKVEEDNASEFFARLAEVNEHRAKEHAEHLPQVDDL